MATVTIGTFMTKPLYRATVTIKIDKENPNILSFKDVFAIERADDDYYQTQYDILRSRNLARRVIRRMKLNLDPQFDGRPRAAKAVPLLSRAKPLTDDGIDPSLISSFLSRVEVKPQGKSRLVNVSFISASPELSAKVANAIADGFIALNVESKFGATQQARQWLQTQLDEMKAKVERTEEKLNSYAGKNGIIFLTDKGEDNSDNGSGENITTKKLSELSKALTAATADRMAKEAQYNEVISGDPASSSVVMNDALVSSLRTNYASLQSQYNQNLKIYKPDYPKMVMLREMMKQTKERMVAETKSVVSSLKKDYEAAVKHEKYLQAAFDKQKKEALNLNDRTVQYRILKREADTDRELYNGLLQRLKETGISASLSASNIQVLDRAEVPKAPFKPRKSRNIAMALMLGLFGGVGLAFFAEYLDNTVKTIEDVEKRTYMPSLGLVPLYGGKVSSVPVECLTYHDANSPFGEAFSSMRTFLLFSTAGRPPKVMMVTSPGSGEGKTTTLLNTAISLTRSDRRVLVIDADMRKPRLHRILKVNNRLGLSSFLSGNAQFSPQLIKKTGIKGVDVMTAGPIPPNASELLGSYRLRELIDGVYPLYDFILFDTPPVLGLSDAAIISTQTDGVIMVVRSGKTAKEAAQQARKVLAGINAKILGVVLNAMKGTDLKYSYHYQYYYHNDRSNENR